MVLWVLKLIIYFLLEVEFFSIVIKNVNDVYLFPKAAYYEGFQKSAALPN
jgi:hypothetical protein